MTIAGTASPNGWTVGCLALCAEPGRALDAWTACSSLWTTERSTRTRRYQGSTERPTGGGAERRTRRRRRGREGAGQRGEVPSCAVRSPRRPPLAAAAGAAACGHTAWTTARLRDALCSQRPSVPPCPPRRPAPAERARRPCPASAPTRTVRISTAAQRSTAQRSGEPTLCASPRASSASSALSACTDRRRLRCGSEYDVRGAFAQIAPVIRAQRGQQHTHTALLDSAAHTTTVARAAKASQRLATISTDMASRIRSAVGGERAVGRLHSSANNHRHGTDEMDRKEHREEEEVGMVSADGSSL